MSARLKTTLAKRALTQPATYSPFKQEDSKTQFKTTLTAATLFCSTIAFGAAAVAATGSPIEDAVIEADQAAGSAAKAAEATAEAKVAKEKKMAKEGAQLEAEEVSGDVNPIDEGDAAQMNAHNAATKKPVSKMTCEDFLVLDESFQPEAVSLAVAYGSNGQPEAEALAVEGVETVTPYIVEECKKAPKESFWKKAQAESKKMF